jgi:hypothetical protein
VAVSLEELEKFRADLRGEHAVNIL